jgi:hypothetical protein
VVIIVSASTKLDLYESVNLIKYIPAILQLDYLEP